MYVHFKVLIDIEEIFFRISIAKKWRFSDRERRERVYNFDYE